MLREFIRDDIEALKSKQVVGEANTGLLVLLTPPSDPAEKQQAQTLLEQENSSRRVIFQRALSSNRELSEKDLPMIQRLFFRMNRQTARANDRVQEEDGRWIVVSETKKAP